MEFNIGQRVMSGGTECREKHGLLVVNPSSRYGAMSIEAAKTVLAAHGIAVTQESCPGRAELARLIRRWRQRIDRVILGGGDGTLNAAIPALVEMGLPLGILPLGTANDLARTLNIPTDLVAASEIITAGHTHRIDVGRVNDQFFFNVASLGLSTLLTRRITAEGKRRWGSLSYALALASIVVRARPFSAELRCGGQPIKVKTVQISVGNGRYYGGGFVVEQNVRIDDRQLDVYSLEARNSWQLLVIAPWLRSGRHGAWRQVRTLACPAVEIRTRRPRAISTDGEITTSTPASFSILPQAVTVFAPAGAVRVTHLPDA